MSKTRKIEIPAGAKVYNFNPVVEVCGECKGAGKINDEYGTFECDVCNGTGRVVKTKTVIIDVKPYL